MAKQTKAEKLDAVELLKEDHRRVEELFKRFDKANDDGGMRAALAGTICSELTVHAQLEEEVFYPRIREALDEDDLINEAEVEHQVAKDLIGQLSAMSPDDEKFAATMTVLCEYIEHHVEEEEDEMFKKVKKAKIDLEALGAEMQERKLAIEAQLGAGQSGGEVQSRVILP